MKMLSKPAAGVGVDEPGVDELGERWAWRHLARGGGREVRSPCFWGVLRRGNPCPAAAASPASPASSAHTGRVLPLASHAP